MTRRALLVLAIAVACTGKKVPQGTVTQAGKPSESASEDPAAARAAIQATNAKFVRWMTNGTADSLATIYVPDAVGMYTNEKALKGRDAITAYWKGVAGVGKVEQLVLETADLAVSGPSAVERGTYNVRIRPKAGAPIVDHGNYVVVWVRDGGEWKLEWDIAATDTPAR